MRLALLTLALVLSVACDDLPGRPRYEDRPLRPTEVTDFDTLYSNNCQGCHGVNGSLGAARNLNDPVYLALASDAILTDVIANGRPGSTMPAFGSAAGGTLTDEQVGILVNQMRERWSDPSAVAGVTLPRYGVQPEAGDGARGQGVFATFCGRCHGNDGAGGEHAGSVVDDAFLALVSDQALRTAVICGRTDLGAPDWRGLVPGKVMTEQQIDDVVAFLIAQRVPFPGRPYPEGR